MLFLIMFTRVALFAGEGAVLARDVEYALKKIGIEYEKIYKIDEILKRVQNDSGKRDDSGKRKGFTCLIIPGGYTEVMTRALDLPKISEFISSGGGYIGICAGAYIAADTVEVKGRPRGAGIIKVHNIRKSGSGVRRIKIVNPEHRESRESGFHTEDIPEEIKIWYQNGPFIVPDKDVEVIATYDTTGFGRSGDLPLPNAAIVCGHYGKGRVVLFSPHPEGSITWGVKPDELGTLPLLKNACEWVVKVK